VRDLWDRRIRRAEQLAATGGPSASLLTFYGRLLRSQKGVYDSFNRLPPSGSLEQDLPLVIDRGSELLHEVAGHGPDQLVVEAYTLLEMADSAISNRLLRYWAAPSDRQFFPKAILQPYAQWLVDAGVTPGDRAPAQAANRCPRCAGAPQLSILETAGAASACAQRASRRGPSAASSVRTAAKQTSEGSGTSNRQHSSTCASTPARAVIAT